MFWPYFFIKFTSPWTALLKENDPNNSCVGGHSSHETQQKECDIVVFCGKSQPKKWQGQHSGHIKFDPSNICVSFSWFLLEDWGTLGIPNGRLGNLREDSDVFVFGHLFFGYLHTFLEALRSATNPSIWWNSARCVALRKSRMVRFGWFDFFPLKFM